MYQYRNNQKRTTYRFGEHVIAGGETLTLTERLDPVPGFLEDLNPPKEKPKKEASKKLSAKKSKKVIKDETTDDKTTN